MILFAFNNKFNKYMIADSDEKKLVENYKATNKQLRKQLQNLNNQVDKIIAFKTNRIGLKKLPAVDKSIQKSQDVKLLQLEVDNLRKRLQQLTHDSQDIRVRIAVDHMTVAKQLEDSLKLKKSQKQALQKQIYSIDKVSMSLNTKDVPEEERKVLDHLEAVNQELIKVKKIESDLLKEIQTKQKNQSKKADFIKNSVQGYNKVIQEVQNSRVQMPATHRETHNEEMWRDLKKQFLQLKESKIWEQTALKQENERIRTQIRQLELRLRQKKYTLENIKSLELRRNQRNYSTLEQQTGKPEKSDKDFRYRGRNNSYKYSKKN